MEMAHGYAPDARILYIGANSCLDTDLMDAESYVIDHRAADINSNSWAEVIHTSTDGHLGHAEDGGLRLEVAATFCRGSGAQPARYCPGVVPCSRLKACEKAYGVL